jgi:hypothetical protein
MSFLGELSTEKLGELDAALRVALALPLGKRSSI